MLAHANVIDVLFRCSIFAILAYKIYDLGSKYLIPYLTQQTELVAKQQAEIDDKEKLIASTHNRIESQIYRQQEMFVTLEKNVQQQHHLMLTLHAQQEKELRLLNQRIQEKRTTQQKNVTAQKNLSYALPQALTMAEEELVKKYQGETGKLFLQQILTNYMQQKNHHLK